MQVFKVVLGRLDSAKLLIKWQDPIAMADLRLAVVALTIFEQNVQLTTVLSGGKTVGSML